MALWPKTKAKFFYLKAQKCNTFVHKPKAHKGIEVYVCTTNPISNISFTTQKHRLAFRLRHKHDLFFVPQSYLFISSIGWFFSLGATLVGCCIFDFFFVLVWWPIIFALFTSGHILSQILCCEEPPHLFLGHWLQCYGQSCCPPPCVGKLWKLEQGIHHLVFQPSLDNAFLSKFVHHRCSIDLGLKIVYINTYASFSPSSFPYAM